MGGRLSFLALGPWASGPIWQAVIAGQYHTGKYFHSFSAYCVLSRVRRTAWLRPCGSCKGVEEEERRANKHTHTSRQSNEGSSAKWGQREEAPGVYAELLKPGVGQMGLQPCGPGGQRCGTWPPLAAGLAGVTEPKVSAPAEAKC